MSITINSNTFSVPKTLTAYDDHADTCILKRTSANDTLPIVLEGNHKLNLAVEVKEGHYLSYMSGATLDTIDSFKIDTIVLEERLYADTIKVNSLNKYQFIRISTGTLDFTDYYRVGGKLIVSTFDGNVFFNIIALTATIITVKEEILFAIDPLNDRFYKSYYQIPIITLANFTNNYWNDFPTTDTTTILWSEFNNVKYKSDYEVDLYYVVDAVRVDELIYDIEHDPTSSGVTLDMKPFVFNKALTKEDIRVGNIYDEEYYNSLTYIDSSLIEDITYVISDSGHGVRGTIPIDLSAKIIKLNIKPESNDDSEITINIEDNGQGRRNAGNVIEL